MINISWFNGTQDTVYFRIAGSWTWEEYYHAVDVFNTMLDASPFPVVHVIFDYSKGAIFPKNTVSVMARNSHKSHPKTGLIIVVGANAFILSLYRILGTVAPKPMERVRFLRSLTEVPSLMGQSVA